MTKNINAYDTVHDYEVAALTYPNVSFIKETLEVKYAEFPPGAFSVRFIKRDGTHVDIMTATVGNGSRYDSVQMLENYGLTVNLKTTYDAADTDGQPTDIVDIRIGNLCKKLKLGEVFSKWDGGSPRFNVSISAVTFTDDCTIEEIGYACFSRLAGIKQIVFPASLEKIGNYPDFMANVDYVEFLGAAPPAVYGAFNYTNYTEDCPIYVPQGTRDVYLQRLLPYFTNMATRIQERVYLEQ